MKSCPTCSRTYSDETLSFCLVDGSILSAPYGQDETQVLPAEQAPGLPPTVASPAPERSETTVAAATIASPESPSESFPSLRERQPEVDVPAARKSKRWIWLIAGVGGILAVGILIAIWSGRESAQTRLTKLTASGRAHSPTISPDGRYVAYVEGDDSGLQSVWVRQVSSLSALQIVAPTKDAYKGLAFSRDGNYIFFTTEEQGGIVRSLTFYQIPVLGGVAKQLISNADSSSSLSPDGKLIAHTDVNSIILSNVDGSEKRALPVAAKNTESILGFPSWSPDGTYLAYVLEINGQPVLRVSKADGSEIRTLRSLEGDKNYNPANWSPDGKLVMTVDGIVRVADGEFTPLKIDTLNGGWSSNTTYVTAARHGTDRRQVFEISYPSGEVRKITDDSNSYARVSVSPGSGNLVALQVETDKDTIGDVVLISNFE